MSGIPFRCLAVLLAAAPVLLSIAPARAGVLVTNVFFNTVDLYDDQTGQLLEQGFFAPPAGPGEVLYLADVIVDPANNHAFVSANFADSNGITRVYHFDAGTGELLPSPSGGQAGVFLELDGSQSNPAGLALDAGGDLYVANQGGLTVDRFDATGAFVRSYGDGGQSILLPSGLAFDAGGDLLVSNFGTGSVVKVNTATGDISPVSSQGPNGPLAPNGVLAGPNGELLVADVFGNGVLKYAADGTEITAPGGGPFVEIDLPNVPPTAIHPNAPSGLALDANGDLLVAVLGPANPFDPPFEVHGALLRFDSDDGSLIQELGLGLPPAGGLALVAESDPVVGIPEPASIRLALLGGGALVCLAVRRRFARR